MQVPLLTATALQRQLLEVEPKLPKPWIAYMLATVHHETAGTYRPIREYGGPVYFEKRYGAGTRVGAALGNNQEGDGARYCGRGYVQITGRKNYRTFGIEDCPEKALEPGKAKEIMVRGMIEGLFTGKGLAAYTTDQGLDFIQARRIINGLDKADIIARYARYWMERLA